MTSVVEAHGLTKRFGNFTAVDNVNFAIEKDKIYGLLGRNGAGKTTMMNLLTAQDFATAGTALVFGESPVENAKVLRKLCFIKESQKYPDDFKPKHVFASAPWFFENWDSAFAERLIDDFRLPLNRRIKKVSRGSESSSAWRPGRRSPSSMSRTWGWMPSPGRSSTIGFSKTTAGTRAPSSCRPT